MNPTDALNFSINWSKLGDFLEKDHWKEELVMDLPPVEGNENFWNSDAGTKFSVGRERQKNSYMHGLMVGPGSGDTFSIVQMNGRKPPTRK